MSDETFRDFVADQLSSFEGLLIKCMFGGYDLYQDTSFFGMVAKGKPYFKTSKKTLKDYLKLGAKPFRYEKRNPKTGARKTVSLKRYYEVPVNILENSRDLCDWARNAASV